MVVSFSIALTMGTVLGFLSGLGVGGGSLLLLWLTLVLKTELETARSINLLFFLPSAAVACGFRMKQGTLEIRKVLPGILAGCCGAILGQLLAGKLDTSLVQKGFGILLLATGIRELRYKPKKKAPG